MKCWIEFLVLHRNTWNDKNIFLVQYSECISAEGKESPNDCPKYDSKQYDGATSVTLELWGM